MNKFIVIFSIVIFYLSGCSPSYNDTIINVIDGDTFVFQTEQGAFTVRMQGIDAPERDQPFSSESTKFLVQYLNKPA